jgi:hypothetical protein
LPESYFEKQPLASSASSSAAESAAGEENRALAGESQINPFPNDRSRRDDDRKDQNLGKPSGYARTFGFSEHVIVGRIVYAKMGTISGHKVINCRVSVTPWRRFNRNRQPTFYEISLWDHQCMAFSRLGFNVGDLVLFRLDNVRAAAWIDKNGGLRASIKGAVDKFLDLRPNMHLYQRVQPDQQDLETPEELESSVQGPDLEDNPWLVPPQESSETTGARDWAPGAKVSDMKRPLAESGPKPNASAPPTPENDLKSSFEPRPNPNPGNPLVGSEMIPEAEEDEDDGFSPKLF